MDFGMLGCSWAWGLDQAGEHGECLSKIIGLVGWYVGQWVSSRFAGLAGGVANRLAGFTGRVAGFDRGLTRYAGFSGFAQ